MTEHNADSAMYDEDGSPMPVYRIQNFDIATTCDDDVAEAMTELDRLDGTLVPEIVQVFDGFYRQRIVLEMHDFQARFVREESDLPDVIPWRYEECFIPKFRTELVWVPGENASYEAS